jgi:hypothetical protein
VTNLTVLDDSSGWLSTLKTAIQQARTRAVLSVNQELVRLFHRIGTEILERLARQDWGNRVIERLSADLRESFPDMKGFSSRNLKYMNVFTQLCPTLLIGQHPAAQLPWFHIVTLLTKVTDATARDALSGISKPMGVADGSRQSRCVTCRTA